MKSTRRSLGSYSDSSDSSAFSSPDVHMMVSSPLFLPCREASVDSMLLDEGYASKNEKEKTEYESMWIHDRYFSINVTLFNMLGIIAISEPPRRFKHARIPFGSLITKNTFRFGLGHFWYGNECDLPYTKNGYKILTQTKLLVQKLQSFSDQSLARRIEKSLEVPLHLNVSNRKKKKFFFILTLIQEYVGEKNEDDGINENKNIIYRHSTNHCYDPIPFLPFTINNASQDKLSEKISLRMYPWISGGKANNVKLNGIKKFVISCCMFGAGIEGESSNGARFPIIKHDIWFDGEQKIESIICTESSFYEEGQFAVFKIIALMMQKLGDEKYEVICHLPSVDYILFGVRLYLEEKITLEALEDFLLVISSRKEESSRRINEIFGNGDQIKVTITCPFENLFGTINGEENVSTIVLEKLGLKEGKYSQEVIVRRCLDLLMNNNYHPEYAATWCNFVKTTQIIKGGSNSVTTLEELFKVGNASMLGMASYNMLDYEVCSIQPYSEMQIQKTFSRYSQKSHTYPIMLYITYFDLLVAYTARDSLNAEKRAGIAFYYTDDTKESGQKLLANGIFKQANQNGVYMPGDEKHVPLEKQHLKI
ncbi:MAG: hypothetical protein K0R24_1184 [Gammaproteobacteria bacterium]|nr:hypothetical protein [Gammaproteobacteria bacterium]